MSARLATLLLGLGAALAAPGCNSFDTFGYRDQRCDPDERLAELLDQWRCCREERQQGPVVDCGRVKNEIERLALEFPRHVPTRMAIATLAYEEGDTVETARELDRLLAVEREHPEAAILRSRVAVEEGNLPSARRRLEEQVRYAPDHAGVREALAAVLYMQGELDGAERALSIAEHLGSPAWRIAFNRGLVAEARGELGRAREQYAAAAGANPEYRPARARLDGLAAEAAFGAAEPPRPEQGPAGG